MSNIISCSLICSFQAVANRTFEVFQQNLNPNDFIDVKGILMQNSVGDVIYCCFCRHLSKIITFSLICSFQSVANRILVVFMTKLNIETILLKNIFPTSVVKFVIVFANVQAKL